MPHCLPIIRKLQNEQHIQPSNLLADVLKYKNKLSKANLDWPKPENFYLLPGEFYYGNYTFNLPALQAAISLLSKYQSKCLLNAVFSFRNVLWQLVSYSPPCMKGFSDFL